LSPWVIPIVLGVELEPMVEVARRLILVFLKKQFYKNSNDSIMNLGTVGEGI
jgi:hypothetical protein